jgi:aminobenzoyl-glutamate utilization protein A
MKEKIFNIAQELKEKTIVRRRDFHKYAESGWTEFRTASKVYEVLSELGYDIYTGSDVIKEEDMMDVPSAKVLETHIKRAIEQGADPKIIEKMQGGKTGIMAVMKFKEPGPVVALRFDMDANDVVEGEDDNHRPYREGFASVNKGVMHACGHDGHTATGLAVAEALVKLKDDLKGTVKLIFQPAEEGVRGAKSMATRGIVDDVNYFIGMHVGLNSKETGQMSCCVGGFLATSKLDAIFTGAPAHAGVAPETGKNALLAAAAATLNLHAISRHSKGASRINVGYLNGGTGRNVIPANAILKLETRGGDTSINEYMCKEAIRVLEASAAMYDVEIKILHTGGAACVENDAALVKRLEKVAQDTAIFKEIVPSCDLGGSEDCTYLMDRVQQKGGQATYVMIGAAMSAGHHHHYFDFDEECMFLGTVFLTSAAVALLNE